MQCSKCGHELNQDGRCSYCGAAEDEKVHVMSAEEKIRYNGVTIEETPEQEQSGQQYRHQSRQGYHEHGGPGVFMKHIDLGSLTGGNWAMKLAVLLLVAAVVAFLVFIALPVALIGIAIGAVVWLILSFLRG